MTLSQEKRKWGIKRIKQNHYEVTATGFEIDINNGVSQLINYDKEELLKEFQHCVKCEIISGLIRIMAY
jgi:hypothetical protein